MKLVKKLRHLATFPSRYDVKEEPREQFNWV